MILAVLDTEVRTDTAELSDMRIAGSTWYIGLVRLILK